MTVYEELSRGMNAQVDTRLGDSITYIVNGVPLEREPGVPTIPGFLVLLHDPGGFDGVQPQQRRWNCKIHRDFLPAGGVDARHRIQSPKLDAVYRPAADTLAQEGDYILFDLQRASN